MGWEEWIDLDTIRACVRHATGAIPALLIFALVGLFLWLVYQMGCILWNRREKVRGGVHALAA